jgi:hypothetical protein
VLWRRILTIGRRKANSTTRTANPSSVPLIGRVKNPQKLTGTIKKPAKVRLGADYYYPRSNRSLRAGFYYPWDGQPCSRDKTLHFIGQIRTFRVQHTDTPNIENGKVVSWASRINVASRPLASPTDYANISIIPRLKHARGVFLWGERPQIPCRPEFLKTIRRKLYTIFYVYLKTGQLCGP